MRVLIISHTYISRINRDKWKILSQYYPNTKLLIVFPKAWPTTLFTHEAIIHQEEQLDNCLFVTLDAFKTGNELLYGYSLKQLYNTIKNFKPDLIHVEQGDAALSYFQANLCCKYLNKKIKSVFFTWINWKPNHSLKYNLLWKPIEKINRRCATGAIAGNQEAQELLRQKGFNKPIMVLPQLGVNTDIFKPAKKLHPASLKSVNYIGFIGRITDEKGVFLLLNAFFKIHQKFPHWNLIFIGKGPALPQLNNFIAQKKLHHRIEFCQPVPHEKVALLLQKMDILVLPSYDTPLWKEQFGHVLIEAMACKIPILGSSAGPIPHVIDQAGLIFEQKNEASLLAQLQTLMQDENSRKQLGELGLTRAHEHYSHKVIADKTYQFWNRLLS